jgi:hypothetical protein
MVKECPLAWVVFTASSISFSAYCFNAWTGMKKETSPFDFLTSTIALFTFDNFKSFPSTSLLKLTLPPTSYANHAVRSA